MEDTLTEEAVFESIKTKIIDAQEQCLSLDTPEQQKQMAEIKAAQCFADLLNIMSNDYLFAVANTAEQLYLADLGIQK